MEVTYENKVAPLQANCCFAPFNQPSHQFLSPSKAIFRPPSQLNQSSLISSEKFINDRKEGIQAMKKSISSINLKRKNSQGFQTNRVSINHSQFLNGLQKRKVTYSMDPQTFKQYIPFSQSIDNLNGYNQQNKYQQGNNQYFQQNTETLDSLAEKFKKNRQSQIQNVVQQTRKYEWRPYQNTGTYEVQNLQKTSGKQFANNNKFLQNFQKTKSSQISGIQMDINYIKNPEQIIGKEVRVQNQQKHQNDLIDEFQKNKVSQVDSMIIEIKAPKENGKEQVSDKKPFVKKFSGFLGENKQMSESMNLMNSKIDKTRKKSLKYDRNLHCDTMTVNSDYQQDQHERKERIEESAILMNFFNPPSFIKDKLMLSSSKNNQKD